MAVVARREVDWLRLLAWALPALAALGVALAVAAPLLISAAPPLPYWGALDYLLFHSACHQQPDRCLWLGGAPMALCARCTALYGGFALIGFVSQFSVWRAFATQRRRLFWLALALLLADVGSELFGLRGPFLPTRLLTGVITGAAGAWFIVPALLEQAAETQPAVSPRTAIRTELHITGGGLHVTQGSK